MDKMSFTTPLFPINTANDIIRSAILIGSIESYLWVIPSMILTRKNHTKKFLVNLIVYILCVT